VISLLRFAAFKNDAIGLTYEEHKGNNDPCPQPTKLAPPPPPAADQAIAACGGDAQEAVKALMVANDFLEAQLGELMAKISTGYARGRLPTARARREDPDV
jgi:hypothetical protein